MTSAAAERRDHRLRADALRNRERIATAALDAFIEFGLEAPLDEIARRAGVGNATLYRHFADRRQLFLEVTLSVLSDLTAEAQAALDEEPDPFSALRRCVHRAADRRAGAIFPSLSKQLDMNEPALREARERLLSVVEEIMSAAHQSGQLRPDVALGDLMVALTQLSRPLPGMACVGLDRFLHRHLELFLDGLQTPPRSVLPGPATTLDDLRQCCDAALAPRRQPLPRG